MCVCVALLWLTTPFRKFSQNPNAGHKSASHGWIIEEHPMKQAFGAGPAHEQRAAYLFLRLRQRIDVKLRWCSYAESVPKCPTLLISSFQILGGNEFNNKLILVRSRLMFIMWRGFKSLAVKMKLFIGMWAIYQVEV